MREVRIVDGAVVTFAPVAATPAPTAQASDVFGPRCTRCKHPKSHHDDMGCVAGIEGVFGCDCGGFQAAAPTVPEPKKCRCGEVPNMPCSNCVTFTVHHEPGVPMLECDECKMTRSTLTGLLGEIHDCPRRGAFRLVHYPASVADAPEAAPVPEDREEATAPLTELLDAFHASTPDQHFATRLALVQFVAGIESRNRALEEKADAYDRLNTPEVDDFLAAVKNEALHQRERWTITHDGDKQPGDWFWLVGYLAGKALHDVKGKRLHHIITAAAALLNWHGQATGHYAALPVHGHTDG